MVSKWPNILTTLIETRKKGRGKKEALLLASRCCVVCGQFGVSRSLAGPWTIDHHRIDRYQSLHFRSIQQAIEYRAIIPWISLYQTSLKSSLTSVKLSEATITTSRDQRLRRYGIFYVLVVLIVSHFALFFSNMHTRKAYALLGTVY